MHLLGRKKGYKEFHNGKETHLISINSRNLFQAALSSFDLKIIGE